MDSKLAEKVRKLKKKLLNKEKNLTMKEIKEIEEIIAHLG